MALPALNNQNAIGNLSLDDKSQILTSLVQSGKLQLVNYGAINLNQNVTSNATATKENSSNYFGEAMVRALENIKGLLFDLNNNILRYIETTTTSQQVTQNLLESKAKDMEVTKTEGGIGIGKENLEKFYKIFESMNNGILKLSEGVGIGGTFGTGKGFLGSLLTSLLPKLLKGFLFGAAGAGIYKAIDWLDDREMNNSPWEKAKKFAKDTLGLEFEEEGENQEQRTAEQNTSGSNTTSGPTNAGRNTTNQGTPGTVTTQETPGTATRTTAGAGTSAQTATRKRFGSINDPNIATESDLTGLKFTEHKGLSVKEEKQILKSLAQRLQYIRKKLGGKSLTIFSGYRPEWYNRKTRGAAKDSQHIQRKAVDVSKQSIGSKKDQILFVKSAVEAGIGGIGFYDTFIHIDIRPRNGGRISRWNVDKIPKEALDIINNPNNYTMDGSFDEERGESTHQEPEENKDTNTTPTANVDNKPTTSNVPTPTNKGKEISEKGTTASPEYEDEQEEVGEEILTESTTKTKQQTATKEETATKETATQSNEKKVFDFFVNKGFTKEQAAGITGSLKIESPTFNPNQKQKSGGPGRGIAQWSVDGPRFKELKARKGNKWNTLNGQLEYIYEEITGQTKHKEYGNVYKNIKSAKSAKEATEIWTKEYEKAGKENMTQRISAAEGILKKYSIGSTETELAQETPNTGDAAKPKEQQTDTEEQPKEKTLVDTIKDAFGSTLENITKPGNIKSVVDEGLYQGLSAIGEGFTFAGVEGFDNSRLRKLKKPEETTDEKIVRMATEFFRPEETANLQSNVTEELSGKRLEETTKNNESLKEAKMEAIKAPQEPQAPNINVNAPVSGGNGGGDDFAAGGISKMDVRDSVLHQMQYRKGSSSALV
jgi:uncharacterized protein YcbK (DUF882 family)